MHKALVLYNIRYATGTGWDLATSPSFGMFLEKRKGIFGDISSFLTKLQTPDIAGLGRI